MTGKRTKATILATIIAAIGLASPAAGTPAKPAGRWVVDSVVVVMRHGVRPPTKDPAMPAGIAAQEWPRWDVPAGWLTAHGALAAERVGVSDAAWLRRIGLWPRTRCVGGHRLRLVADSDQRTIATAQSWAKGALGACQVTIDHSPQGEDDPRFNPLTAGLARLNPTAVAADLAKTQGPDGLAALDANLKPLVARLNTVLCGAAQTGCGIPDQPSTIRPATTEARPKLAGMLDRASTAAQILLLEYADGKPLAEVGWGRASAQDIAAFSRFHAEEFRLLARPRALAVPNLAGLLPDMVAGLKARVKLTVIVGHDTNVANLGGALGLHWHLPGYAADDPAPGGAIILTVAHDRTGAKAVRAYYRAQSLQQLRKLDRGQIDIRQPIAIEACRVGMKDGGCPLDEVLRQLNSTN